MNYIMLLNAAFEKLYFDDRLKPTHISLYMALFQEWNRSRFADEFFINRRDLMRAAKIGSKPTYHRCITDLSFWGYLSYYPSNTPYKSSKVKMAIIRTGNERETGDYDPKLEQLAECCHPIRGPIPHPPNNGQVVYPNRPTDSQALVSTINNTKPIKHSRQPNSLEVVLNFFNAKHFNLDYEKFFKYYRDRDWQTSDGIAIRNWRALAMHWMGKIGLIVQKEKINKKEVSQIQDNLRTTKNKDYGQPL